MNKKRLSVVLAALDDYEIIEQVHLCLEDQTAREDLELILVCRSRESLGLPVGFEARYPDMVIVEGGEGILLNEAREVGIQRASTPYVLILEDHCLPFAGCLEAMIARLEGGWSAVGPAIISGNTKSKVAMAANLLTYGQWMGRTKGGERSFVSGYNSAYRVRVLLDRGELLTEDLVAPSTLQLALARQGHRFYFEPKAKMAHWEASDYWGVMEILPKNGRGLGMLRARQWSVGRKLLGSMLSPPLMAYRFLRGCQAWWRTEPRSAQSLVHLLPLSFFWTFGELRGYWCRDRRGAIAELGAVEKNRQRHVDTSLEPIRKPI